MEVHQVGNGKHVDRRVIARASRRSQLISYDSDSAHSLLSALTNASLKAAMLSDKKTDHMTLESACAAYFELSTLRRQRKKIPFDLAPYANFDKTRRVERPRKSLPERYQAKAPYAMADIH